MRHPHIVPLLGVTTTPYQLISNWVPGGELSEYILNHPNADRLGLVGAPPVMYIHAYFRDRRLMSLMASTTSTPAMSFTGISREYVVAPSIIPLSD